MSSKKPNLAVIITMVVLLGAIAVGVIYAATVVTRTFAPYL